MSHYDKFLAKLTEIFQLDRADLDFGIYRVLNSKRDEVIRFLENDLLPQVRDVLAKAQNDIGSAGAEDLHTLESQIRAAGMNPDDSPKVRELRAKYSAGGDLGALEQEVFNHLYSFFRRYYDEGDFLSLRRYKEGVYAIPYEGEEVKLHWANADQYYIKTAEHFRDYTFRDSDGRRIHFKLVEAQTERDNNKEKEKRVFILTEENPVIVENGELFIKFEYRNDPEKRKQKDLTELAEKAILPAATSSWKAALTEKAPTEKDPTRTVLTKHLTSYTARNTFDYFIHKDLGGFLRRELDFYIKNEIMHLDDIESETAPKVEQYLSKVRAIRRVASKIIDFLAHLEEFQKALWLKKKFVVETQWCITLRCIPETFFAEIAANEAQREEWVTLFSISEIKGDLMKPAYSESLNPDFLKAHPTLVVDTRHFDAGFVRRLFKAMGDVHEQVDGILIHSENFHAIGFVKQSFKNKITCIHIDPPYNTETSGFLYKNAYQHSSWLSMMWDRLLCGSVLLNDEGHLLSHIDENEYERLKNVSEALGLNDAGTVVWDKRNPMTGGSGNALQHEYIIWLSKSSRTNYQRNLIFVEMLKAAERIVASNGGVNPNSRREYSDWVKDNDALSGGEKAYCYLDGNGKIYQSVSLRAPEPRTDPKFFQPLIHPETGLPCAVPPNGFSRTPETLGAMIARDEILFGADETTQPRQKKVLTNESQMQVKSVIQDAKTGKAYLDQLGLAFPYCHPVSLYEDLIGATSKADSFIFDFFAGSGTSGHAVINLNRQDGGQRKFILVEMGGYFDTVLLPRIKKVTFTPEWKEGKPKRLATPEEADRSPRIVKVIRLESYEDTLANLEIRECDNAQAQLVESSVAVREDYMLRYVMNVETAGSPSLLNVQAFAHPFEYKLNVAADTVGETKEVNVDLVETFNWLLGLRVHTMDVIRGFHIISGRLPGPGNSENGEKALIIWRDTTENPNEKLDEFFNKQAYNTLDQEFDVIYVNGDNNLQNLRRDDQTWKVRLIEEEFHRLMWDVEDV